MIKAPLGGMVALENIWKGGTMGHPLEGDQLFPGQSLMKIFDPSADDGGCAGQRARRRIAERPE